MNEREPDDSLPWSNEDIRFLTSPGFNAHVWAWFAYEAGDEDDVDDDDDDEYVASPSASELCEMDPDKVHRCRYVIHIYMQGVPRTRVHIFGTNYRVVADDMVASSRSFGHYVEVDDQSLNPYGG